MQKKSILKKTFQFGFFTLLSRLLAFPREILQLRFLGAGALSDAFIAAFRLPNFFRRIFAEGALSAAFIPSYVRLTKEKKKESANSTMTISFVVFEGIVLILCIFVFFFPHIVLKIVTPGFSTEQIRYAIPLLRIMFPFLFFISSSALLSGALQAKNHFFAQSFGPVLHNVVYVSTLIICLIYHKHPETLATGILCGGILIFALHLFIYFRFHFTFGAISKEGLSEFKTILQKFFPCLIGVGVVEINLYLDNVISSFLPKGSYTLLYVSNRFMNLPLGVFAVAFSTILLPYFSRISTYAPKRLHFYLLETAKFITWMIVPAMLFLFFAAKPIFTLFLPDQSRTPEATAILICYSTGLIFYCFNKVLINMFYSMHDTWSPTIASMIATTINGICNVIGMYYFGAPGIALSTAISGVTLTLMCIHLFDKKHKFRIYWENYFLFLIKYVLQLAAGAVLFLGIHFAASNGLFGALVLRFVSVWWGYWLFTISLFLSTITLMFLTKKSCKIKLYFLEGKR
jgi:putative peptidoglycan lipid II flippase